jgi:hypothetical protein
MRAAALAFLKSLDDEQRQAATYDFADDERHRWQYTPGPRGGLSLARMDPSQLWLAMRLLDSGLSDTGAVTARSIIELEPLLRAIEEQARIPGFERRNPDLYWFSVFGDPSGSEPWGWRVGGHHLCLHFTEVGDGVSVTPLFFGANPARVPAGEQEGLRVLGPEEDLARALLNGLDEHQRGRAVVSDEAPRDILTGNEVRAQIAAVPTGIGYQDLDEGQRASLRRLVDLYLDRVRKPTPVGLEQVTFAWAGSSTPGEGHYYALRSDTFLVEYDNTQNHANHVHTVWRDLGRDWGEDLLAEHYVESHGR